MTREEFLQIDNICDLKDKAYDLGLEYEYFEDVYYGVDMDDIICNDIRDFLGRNYYYELKPILERIDISTSGLYKYNGTLDYYELGEDDFVSIKEEMLEYMDNNDYFDDDDDDCNEDVEENTGSKDDNGASIVYGNGDLEIWEVKGIQDAMITALLK